MSARDADIVPSLFRREGSCGLEEDIFPMGFLLPQYLEAAADTMIKRLEEVLRTSCGQDDQETGPVLYLHHGINDAK